MLPDGRDFNKSDATSVGISAGSPPPVAGFEFVALDCFTKYLASWIAAESGRLEVSTFLGVQ
jgi:hypothetical protein